MGDRKEETKILGVNETLFRQVEGDGEKSIENQGMYQARYWLKILLMLLSLDMETWYYQSQSFGSDRGPGAQLRSGRGNDSDKIIPSGSFPLGL